MGKREKEQKKKKAAAAKSSNKKEVEQEEVDVEDGGDVEQVEEGMEKLDVDSASTPKSAARKKEAINPRSCTGVLSSQSLSRDLKIENFSMALYGQRLIDDTRLEFNWGRRYGLIGPNGSGKSTLLTILGNREAPIPPHFTIYHLDREADASEKTALEWVIADVEIERNRLEKEAEILASTEEGSSSERLFDIYESLDQLEADLAQKRAGVILHGLGLQRLCKLRRQRTSQEDGVCELPLLRLCSLYPRCCYSMNPPIIWT